MIDTAKAQRQLTVQAIIVNKQKAITALHITAYSSTIPVEQVSVEFFYAMGSLLEGVAPKDLQLHMISKEAFLQEYEDT